MKIAMLQYDERVNDENINLILDVNRKYCKIHGYDHIFKAIKEEDTHQHELDDYLMDKTDQKIQRLNLYDYRIYMIEKYLNDYDYLVYCDTDMLVNNPIIKIEDLIDNEHDVFMFADIGKINVTVDSINIANEILKKCKSNSIKYLQNPLKDLLEMKINGCDGFERIWRFAANPEGIASGFIIINCKSKKIQEFIVDFKRFYPLFENSFFDQGCIATLLRMTKYKDILKILPFHLHGSPFLNNVLPEFGLDREKAFVCHFYGENSRKKECKAYIEEIKNNKWWSQIK